MNNIFRCKTEFFHYGSARRGSTEPGHTDNNAVASNVTFPSHGNTGFDGNTHGYIRQKHAVLIFLGCCFKQFPARHVHNPDTNTLAG